MTRRRPASARPWNNLAHAILKFGAAAVSDILLQRKSSTVLEPCATCEVAVRKPSRAADSMGEVRTTAKALLLYLCGLFALAATLFVGLNLVLPGVDLAASLPQREPTRMDLMVSSAREIRAALLKPLPLPEPLGPIIQKPAHAPKAVAKAAPRRLPPEALNAYASGAPDWSASRWSSSAASGGDFDRHKPQ
jgi:hypothetical protein